MNIQRKLSWLVGAFLAVFITTVDASHFRGAAQSPSVDANGLLTITTVSFWRKTAPNTPTAQVTGGALINASTLQVSTVTDQSDARRAKVTSVRTIQLSGAGTYQIDWDGCCHQAGISGASGNWGMDSSITWDGQNAIQPIFFDLENIQQQVTIGGAYSDNLDATAAPGLTLTYGLSVNTGMSAQAPGLALDAAGNLTIPAATTALSPYANTTTFPNGTAFSGSIVARDSTGAQAGQVEFEWVFLTCDPNDQVCTVAPKIQDEVINALVGDTINQTMLAVEDEGQLFQAPNLLTGGWDVLQSFNCSGGAANNAPSWNAASQMFSWNSSGTAVGACTAIFRVTDNEGLTDTGTLLINLATGTGGPACGLPGLPDCAVPVPSTLPLLGLGLGLLGLTSIARRKKHLKS